MKRQTIINAAEQLNCEPEVVAAVINVESSGMSVDKEGFPILLFEPRYFNKFTESRYVAEISAVCQATKSAKVRYNKAFALDPEAAMKSASWGLFQIMGANFRKCGCKSIQEFMEQIKAGEEAQVRLFISFIINSGLSDELQEKRFADFARVYNGPRYFDNRYDEKLKTFYEKFKRDGF